VPNCPVCHQTISLVARHLEANAFPRVVMGCGQGHRRATAVPRFLFSDFPLGNSAGKPHDAASQGFTLETGATPARNSAGSADHRSIAAALERRMRPGSVTTTM